MTFVDIIKELTRLLPGLESMGMLMTIANKNNDAEHNTVQYDGLKRHLYSVYLIIQSGNAMDLDLSAAHTVASTIVACHLQNSST